MNLTTRQELVLKYLSSQHSIHDVSDEFNYGYYSARRTIQELVDKALVAELPFPQPDTGRKLYQAVYFIKEQYGADGLSKQIVIDTLRFTYKDQSLAPIDLLKTNNLDNLAATLANYVRFCLAQPMQEYLVHTQPNNYQPNGGFSVERTQERLFAAIDELKALTRLAEQLAHSPVWDSNVPDTGLLLWGKDINDSDKLEFFRRAYVAWSEFYVSRWDRDADELHKSRPTFGSLSQQATKPQQATQPTPVDDPNLSLEDKLKLPGYNPRKDRNLPQAVKFNLKEELAKLGYDMEDYPSGN